MPATGAPIDKLSDRIRVRARRLSPSLLRVIQYIDTHRHEAMTKSALEIAAAIGTSDATVIRAVQGLGFGGLKELKQVLATALGEGQTPIDNMARTFASIQKQSATAIDQVFADHAETFTALASAETRASILAAVEHLSRANAIGVFGIGSTAYLVRYFALNVTRLGRSTIVLDGTTAPLPDQLLEMRNVDALLMLAYGKAYKEATSTIAEARRRKIPIVLITDSNELALTRHASVVVQVLRGHAGRIALHGSTFVCLEAIILAMAAEDQPRAISTLERLNELRGAIGK